MSEGTKRKHTRQYIERAAPEPRSYAKDARAYSQAVITEGGRIVWLAGAGASMNTTTGESLAGNFGGQVRELFSRFTKTLAQCGGTLADIVTMTVYITDSRYGDEFVTIRKEIWGKDFPASALITCDGLARPEMLVEVQGIAVVD